MLELLLVAILVIVLLVCLLASSNEMLSPSVIFCASFLFCAIWAAAYADSWGFVMGETTLFVVAGGVIEFAIVCMIVRCLVRRPGSHFVNTEALEIKPIELGKLLSVAFIIFEIFALLYTVYEILGAAGTSNLTAALVYYNNTTKFTTETVIFKHGGFLHMLWDVLDALGFWITYPIASQSILKKKPLPELVIFALSVTSNFLRGARTTAIYKILALICVYFLLSRRANKRRITPKNILYVFLSIVAFVVFCFSFKHIGTLMGRTITQSGIDYVALYCGSQIANLDAFLKEGWGGIQSIFDSQSLYGLFYYVRPLFGFTGKVLQVLPARRLGGVILSNVYTTFYQFIYDYGFEGEFIFVALMAVASQISYEYARSTRVVDRVPLSIILYSFVFTTLALSFFSNKFYERIVTLPFFYTVVYWFALNRIVHLVGSRRKHGSRRGQRTRRRG